MGVDFPGGLEGGGSTSSTEMETGLPTIGKRSKTHVLCKRSDTCTQGLPRLNSDLKMFYDETKCEDKIELSMKAINGEKLDQYPCLSGPGIKGATARS